MRNDVTAGSLLSRIAITFVVVGILVTVSATIEPPASTVVDNASQLVLGLAATACCWWACRGRTGAQRWWRLLVGCGMAGWSVGQAIWSWYQIVANDPIPSPSGADIGYLILPPFALAALLVLAVNDSDCSGGGDAAGPRRAPLVLVLDGLIVVGSMFVLTWATALGAAVHVGASTPLAYVVAIAYPATDLVLIVIALLLMTTYRVSSTFRPQLLLLGLGLISLAVSDSIFAFLVSSGAQQIPPAANVGFMAGPAMIAVAALTRVGPATGQSTSDRRRTKEWAYLFLPYAPALVAGTLLVGQVVTGRTLDLVEIAAGLLIIVLVLLRQVVTLLSYAYRLSQVTADRSRAAFQQAADQAVAAIENARSPEPALEDEITDVSNLLSATASRLRQVTSKTEGLQAEVRQLVERAETARAAAHLHERDAHRFAMLLGAEAEDRFRREVAKLTAEHSRQIERLRRSGNLTALWTFVGGTLLGLLGNVVVEIFFR